MTLGTEYKGFSFQILSELTEDVKYVRETVFRVEQGIGKAGHRTSFS